MSAETPGEAEHAGTLFEAVHEAKYPNVIALLRRDWDRTLRLNGVVNPPPVEEAPRPAY